MAERVEASGNGKTEKGKKRRSRKTETGNRKTETGSRKTETKKEEELERQRTEKYAQVRDYLLREFKLSTE